MSAARLKTSHLARLTDREKEYLTLAGDALTIGEAAQALNLSVRSTKQLNDQCRRKLSDTAEPIQKRQLVRWARELRKLERREARLAQQTSEEDTT